MATIGKHYAGPTWEGKDGSKVVGEVNARDNGPDPNAIPWPLLSAKSKSGTGAYWGTKGNFKMNDIIGIAWFKDEATYNRALANFIDCEKMPASFEAWKALVEKELELIKGSGNIALRVDIDPETFTAWCAARGFKPNSQGRIAFVNQVVLEYRKTGKGTVIE